MKRDCYIGIDLGGTKVLVAAVSPHGKILGSAKAATPFDKGATPLVRTIQAMVREALAAAHKTKSELIAIGMGSPGPLDPGRGVILRTPNIDVHHLPIGPLLTRNFGVPVVLDNDVHMAVYGEYHAGAGRGHSDIVGIWIGTGIGGCIMQNGKIIHGINRNAGEVGHMYLRAGKAKPGKPQGTLEWEASKTGMQRELRKLAKKGAKTSLQKWIGKDEHIQSGHLARAWRAGDKPARRVLTHSAFHVGIAIANLFNAIAPELFILGGGVVEDVGAPYVERVRQYAESFAFTTELGKLRVVATKLKGDAGALGAALAAREAHPVTR